MYIFSKYIFGKINGDMENIYRNITYLLVVVMEMEMEKMENIYRNFTY